LLAAVAQLDDLVEAFGDPSRKHAYIHEPPSSGGRQSSPGAHHRDAATAAAPASRASGACRPSVEAEAVGDRGGLD
jgi:hypothetical protein